MPFVDFSVFSRFRTALPARHIFLFCTTAAAAVFISGNAMAQATAKPVASASALQTNNAANPGPQWSELNPAQQKILQPLAASWNALLPARKNKWLSVTQNYLALAPAEQAKLQSRMAEWAALNPQERERARLNFAQTKKKSPVDRTAEWEAYQALSPEEKQKLVEKARSKPVGAAVSPKLVAPNTLTVVPMTRRTTEQNKPAAAAKPTLDKNTLLPIAPRPLQGTSTPAPTTPAPPSAQ